MWKSPGMDMMIPVLLNMNNEQSEQVSHKHRHLSDIEQIINAANLSDRTAQWSLAVFKNLAAAEAAVHGVTPEQVHFHEVGALDAISDIVCTCAALDWLNVDQTLLLRLAHWGRLCELRSWPNARSRARHAQAMGNV
jgi:uncharacterized protein (DUF111 family)